MTAARLRALTQENLASLAAVVEFLRRHHILLYRISSNVIPFGSHRVNRLEWWHEHAPQLRRMGARIRASGIRVSTHPGQYTVLNSPDRAVVRASVRELEYHATLLDALEVDRSSKIVVHIGGVYGADKGAAMERFIRAASTLPEAVLRRLVVENDDRLFNAEEALSVAQRIGVPVVFDWLHHQANPCRGAIRGVLAEAFDTWADADGRPKIHLSSQARGARPGAHADYVAAADIEAFLAIAPSRPFDCMLEAKAKDRALLRLRAELQERGIVESDVHAGRALIG